MCYVTIKIITSLFLTANGAGLNAYIIPVFKVAYEHVLQTRIMPASFVSIFIQRFLRCFDLLPADLDRLACLSHAFENPFRCRAI